MSIQETPHRFVYRDNGVEAYCTVCGTSVSNSDSTLPDAVDEATRDEPCPR